MCCKETFVKEISQQFIWSLVLAAAEGAVLSLFSYDELKSKDSRKPNVEVNLFEGYMMLTPK